MSFVRQLVNRVAVAIKREALVYLALTVSGDWLQMEVVDTAAGSVVNRDDLTGQT